MTMMYLIAYQVKRRTIRDTNEVRETIEDEIVEFGSWWRYFGDVWLIDTQMSVDDMTRVLLKYMDQRDSLLITGIQPPYQGWLPEGAWEWLDSRSKKQEATAAR